MNVAFTPAAFEDYVRWEREDKGVFKKICSLVKEILRTPFEGTGKPEPLRHELAGCWSRRITGEHRLVYQVLEDSVLVISCRFHYE